MASRVTSKIKELLRQRDAKILSGTEYVQRLLDEVKKETIANLAATPADSYSAFSMRQSLASIERYLSSFESAASRELSSGISTTWDMGSDLLPATLQVSGQSGVYLGMNQLSANTIETLKEFTFGRVTNLSNDLFGRIKAELTMGILGQKTPQQVAGEIAGTLNGPSIFKTIAERAEVITGLEMGRAYSIATQMSMESAAETLPELQKLWLHAGHPRMPRQVHLLMHGQIRKMQAPFYQTPAGEPVLYPRDPQAPIKEVIRCGCTHVPFMASWGSAKSFAASWDQKQYQVNFKKAA
jgi:hypothetical protein